MTATSDALNATPRSLDEVQRELLIQFRELTEWINSSGSYPSEKTWQRWDEIKCRLCAVEAEIAARGGRG